MGGKPISEPVTLTEDQTKYAEQEAIRRLGPKGYVLYDSPDAPGTSGVFIWHDVYFGITMIHAVSGRITGNTQQLREGWDTDFPQVVDKTLDAIERHA